MDSVGHYSRPDLLGLRLNAEPAAQVSAMGAPPLGHPEAAARLPDIATPAPAGEVSHV
jgi:hypothetical protein